jgi:hypothetical protein
MLVLSSCQVAAIRQPDKHHGIYRYSSAHNFLNFCCDLWHAPARVVLSSNLLLADFECDPCRLPNNGAVRLSLYSRTDG